MKVNIKNQKISTSFKTERVYPELEDLEVTPTTEEQKFKSSKYGFDNVKVKAIKGDTLNIEPSTEDQTFTGVYENVNVSKIKGEDLVATPSIEDQNFSGVYENVKVNKITSDLIPNLTPDNIAEGKEVLDLVGTHKGGGTLPAEFTNNNGYIYITVDGSNSIVINDDGTAYVKVSNEDRIILELKDKTPTQILQELYSNSLETILTTGANGTIVNTNLWYICKLSDGNVYLVTNKYTAYKCLGYNDSTQNLLISDRNPPTAYGYTNAYKWDGTNFIYQRTITESAYYGKLVELIACGSPIYYTTGGIYKSTTKLLESGKY